MQKRVIATIVLLLLIDIPLAEAGWYFEITPPNSGPSFRVGPYSNRWDAADMLGSALYSHPFACHLDPSNFNCRITGNGFGYPKGFEFPVPLNDLIPGLGPFKGRSGSDDLPAGWYFLFYTATGGSVEKCSSLKYFKKLERTVPGDEIGHYRNMQCPGAPCFSVGFDTACN